jgi:death-on-curing protein
MPYFLTVPRVVAIHDKLIQADGGRLGVLNQGLLESAVEAPKGMMFGQFLYPRLSDQAAAYLFHISKNHAFVDGNKRTAAAASMIFLKDNKAHFRFEEREFEDFIVDVATGKISIDAVKDFFFASCTRIS